MSLKKIALYHLTPFFLALGLVVLSIQLIAPNAKSGDQITYKFIRTNEVSQRGVLANYVDGDQAETNLIASLKNKQQLTLFGSSEFAETLYGSYYFLPDSLGIPTLGIGHAHHQELSILCELLAAKKYLKGSKVCIFISPGWFTNDTPDLDGGTNIEAFIEFVPPHFLSNVAYDKSIDKKYRLHIGHYIDRNYSKINGVSKSMDRLRDEYLKTTKDLYGNAQIQLKKKIYGTETPLAMIYKYQVSKGSVAKTTKWNNWDAVSQKALTDFKKASSHNNLHILDDYYTEYLVDENGKVELSPVEKLDYKNCREYKDFQLLIQLLKENEVECSFVIQPLNPHFYTHLDRYKPLWTSVEKTLNENQFPYLNLFVYNKESYDSGTLRDVMHLGDYGWMKVNKFLKSTYYE